MLLFTIALIVMNLVSGATPPPDVIAQWMTLPTGTHPTIMREEDLPKSFISPIMAGGFGNMLFGIATACAAAYDVGVDCVISWWPHDHPDKKYYHPYGEHGPPAANITLKEIFPNIIFYGNSSSISTDKRPHRAGGFFCFVLFCFLFILRFGLSNNCLQAGINGSWGFKTR